MKKCAIAGNLAVDFSTRFMQSYVSKVHQLAHSRQGFLRFGCPIYTSGTCECLVYYVSHLIQHVLY